MKKNQQVIDFGNIIKDIDSGYVLNYDILRSLFLDFIDYVGESWDDYSKNRTKSEIMGEFNTFNQYYYLPF